MLCYQLFKACIGVLFYCFVMSFLSYANSKRSILISFRICVCFAYACEHMQILLPVIKESLKQVSSLYTIPGLFFFFFFLFLSTPSVLFAC